MCRKSFLPQPTPGNTAGGAHSGRRHICCSHPLSPPLLLLPALCGAVCSSVLQRHSHPPHRECETTTHSLTHTHTHTHTHTSPLQVLLSPQLPFKLGSQALQFLLHQYLCSSLSVSQFSHTLQASSSSPQTNHCSSAFSLQMAMLEHFHWQPLSFFIGKWDTPNTLVRGLRHNQSEMIRATPSFRRCVYSIVRQYFDFCFFFLQVYRWT